MENIKIATAQFENKSGDKLYNLGIIEKLTEEAARQGAQVISFHECSVTGLTHALEFSKEEMLQLAEFIPEGNSIKRLQEIASTYKIAILAGAL